nr:MAG TPA: hypothetical protein [Caudoviricetes sp.]DAQ33671.1 MAG TPA: hypothetical protein [Caudoviricetes sp.]
MTACYRGHLLYFFIYFRRGVRKTSRECTFGSVT